MKARQAVCMGIEQNATPSLRDIESKHCKPVAGVPLGRTVDALTWTRERPPKV